MASQGGPDPREKKNILGFCFSHNFSRNPSGARSVLGRCPEAEARPFTQTRTPGLGFRTGTPGPGSWPVHSPLAPSARTCSRTGHIAAGCFPGCKISTGAGVTPSPVPAPRGTLRQVLGFQCVPGKGHRTSTARGCRGFPGVYPVVLKGSNTRKSPVPRPWDRLPRLADHVDGAVRPLWPATSLPWCTVPTGPLYNLSPRGSLAPGLPRPSPP